MDTDRITKKYKELVMEYIDGVISDSGKEELFSRANESVECKKYLENMEKIKLYTGLMKAEAPDYLESKIMAAVNEAANKEVRSFGLTRGIAYAASFASVLALSILIGYGTLNKGGKAELAGLPDIPEKKPAEKQKPAAVAIKAPEQKAEAAVEKLQPIKSYQPVITDYEKENLERLAIRTVPEKEAYRASVSEVKQGSSYYIAKDETPVPTVTNELLERDKAIVGNNLVNPALGQAAIVKVKVEETTRVRVIIYDKRIREIVTLIDEEKMPGTYQALWYGRNSNNEVVSDGIYHVLIQIGRRVIKKQIVVAR